MKRRRFVIWLDTTYACGAVIADEAGKIVQACPIYRSFIGQHFRKVVEGLKYTKRYRAHRKVG